jgi:hypothetical protein
MPSTPIRRGLAGRRKPDRPDPAATRAELEAVQLAVEELRGRLDPVPGRLAQAAKALDAQHKRLEALTAQLEKTRAALEAATAEPPLPPASQGPLGRARAALGRLRARAAPPAAGISAPQPPPVPPKINWVLAGGKAGPNARAVMVALFGLAPPEIEAVVAKLAAVPDPGDVVRVFLTDDSAFDAFRLRGLPFEYLPRAEPGDGGRRDWGIYQTRRFALLCDKWQPVEVVGLGPVATARLAAWRASPHLPESVRQLLPLKSPEAAATGG